MKESSSSLQIIACALATLCLSHPADAAGGTGGIPRVVNDISVLQEEVFVVQAQMNILSEDIMALTALMEKVEQGSLTDFFDISGSVCFDVGLGIPLDLTNKTRARIEIEGGVGVDVYGNGIEVDFEAVNDTSLNLAAKLGANLTGRICANLGVLKALEGAGVLTANANALQVQNADLAAEMRQAQIALRDMLPALINDIGLHPSNVPLLVDAVQNFDFDLTDPSKMISEGPAQIQSLVQIMPMPPALRARINSGVNPFGIISTRLKNPRASICNDVSNLPGEIGTRIQAICNDDAGKVLAKAISDINTVVNTIRKALPVAGDCKFFCK